MVVTAFAYYASSTYRRALESDPAQPQPQHAPARALAPTDAEDVSAARLRASEAALAARDEFLAVAAHELRTPLTSLLLHIEAIERGVPAPGPVGTMAGPWAGRRPSSAASPPSRARPGGCPGRSTACSTSRAFSGGHLSLELAQVDVAALAREVVAAVRARRRGRRVPAVAAARHAAGRAAGRESDRPDHHQPDRQRAQVRRRRPHRDIGSRATTTSSA